MEKALEGRGNSPNLSIDLGSASIPTYFQLCARRLSGNFQAENGACQMNSGRGLAPSLEGTGDTGLEPFYSLAITLVR
jgi:hypothetical protein